MTNTSTSGTVVKTVDLDIDDLFGSPGADNVMTPESTATQTTPAKPSMFSKTGADISFIDDMEDDVEVPHETVENSGDAVDTTSVIEEIVNEENTDGDVKPAGRPKGDKAGVVSFFKKQYDAGKFFLFDDFDEEKQTPEEYMASLSQKDLDELYDMNVNQRIEEEREKVPKEFFESLPDEMQYAAKYIADGGKDLKGLFRALSHVQETMDLDPTKEGHQEAIVRQFLTASDFGTPEEIESEIETYKDAAILDKKANQLKPKLAAMQQKMVEQQVQAQEDLKKQREDAARTYVTSVFETLKVGELAGIKLDRNRQQALYQGLTNTTYQSITGKSTNQLGHLLEQHQFVKPNHALIAEALWLLSEPDTYREAIATRVKNETNEQTRRTLKTEQSRRNGTGTQAEVTEPASTRKIPRPNANFFKR
jgi:hypothetical protein